MTSLRALALIPCCLLVLPQTNVWAQTPPVQGPALSTLPAAEVERQAEQLMQQGRQAILKEDYAAATEAFTRLLALPANSQSKDAQEFLALALEREGRIDRAREAYERYLQLYPRGEDADRVRQRLANLPRGAVANEILRSPKQRSQTETLSYGSLSQFYYRGNSKIESRTATANLLDEATLSLTDQSALITSFDYTTRWRSPEQDSRVVLRDTHTANLLADAPDRNRLTAAYYDYRHKRTDASVRLGRQPGNSGGVLGYFDGGLFGLGVNPAFRVNLVAGTPVDTLKLDSQRSFYGVSTELGAMAAGWSGSLYVIRQDIDDIVDREAVGTELRYFTPTGSLFMLVDYDTLFATLNTVLLQGNWQGTGGNAYNIMLDARRTPTLQTSTALIGEGTTSINTLLQTYPEAELRRRAEALTATSTLFSIGLTRPLGSTWQFGTDLRVTRISETEGTPAVPASPDSGNVYTLGLQMIGTGVFASRDVAVLSANVISADTYEGVSYAATSRALVGSRWTFDVSLRWYEQQGTNGTDLTRLTPSLRTSYRWRDNVSFEVEAGVEKSQATSATVEEKTRRDFFSLGYRWDF